MVPGSLSDCQQPRLIVNHVHVNQASPKRRLFSRRYNEPPEPLQLWRVIAVHSPKARLYSIRRDTIWMAEAACSVRTYSNMHHQTGLSSLLMCFISTPTGQKGGAVITLCLQREEHRLQSMNHKPSVNIQGKRDQEDWVCESHSKFTVTSYYTLR